MISRRKAALGLACAAGAVVIAGILIRSDRGAKRADPASDGPGPQAAPGLAIAAPTVERIAADQVEGIVVTDAGSPLGNVRVERFVAAGAGLIPAGMSWTTEDGRFAVRVAGPTWFAPAGEPEWVASPALGTPGSSVRIVARSRRNARIRVVDPKGAAVVAASVRVRARERWTRVAVDGSREPQDVVASALSWTSFAFEATTNEQGLAVLPLPEVAGELQLRVEAADPHLFPRTIRPFVPGADSVVRLESGQRVSGVVVDAKGRPFSEGSVVYERAGAEPASIDLPADGTFETPLLAPGPVKLRVTYEFVTVSPAAEIATVPAGTENVHLVVDPKEECDIEMKNPGKERRRVAYVSVEGDEGGGFEPAEVTLAPAGWATLRGLRENLSYVLWIPPTPDAGMVYVRGLRAQEGLRILDDTEEAPIDVQVRWKADEVDADEIEVNERGVIWSQVVFDEQHQLDRPGSWKGWCQADLKVRLPRGTWRFRITAHEVGSESREFAVETVGDSSAPVKVDLHPPPGK